LTDITKTQTIFSKRIGASRLVQAANRSVFIRESGQGDTLLMLPGAFLSNRAWLRFAPLVHDRLHTVAVDLIGVGSTTRARAPRDLALTAQAAMICGLLDTLKIERAHVIGASYGGNVALTFAGLYPDRVRSVVALDAPIMTPNHQWMHSVRPGLEALNFGRLGFWAMVKSSLIARSWSSNLLGRRKQTAPEDKKHTVFECYYDPHARYRGWWSLLRAPIDDPLRPLAAIKVPILFLQGSDSPLHGQLDRMREIFLHVQPNVRWESVPFAQHDIAIQLPALVADTAHKFWDTVK